MLEITRIYMNSPRQTETVPKSNLKLKKKNKTNMKTISYSYYKFHWNLTYEDFSFFKFVFVSVW